MTAPVRRVWGLAAAVVLAGCAFGIAPQSNSVAAGALDEAGVSCADLAQPATQPRAAFTSSQVEQAFDDAGIRLRPSFQSYTAAAAQASARCNGLLADTLLYRGGSDVLKTDDAMWSFFKSELRSIQPPDPQ